MSERPTSFEGIDVKELRRIAVEDFAVEVKPNEKKPDVLAALAASGVTWQDYANLMGWGEPVAVEPVVADETVLPHEEVKVDEEVVVVTQQPLPKNEKFLLKMERKNPVFETQGYRFSQEHPYALVEPEAAEWILQNEDGIRMAFPSELQDFYS